MRPLPAVLESANKFLAETAPHIEGFVFGIGDRAQIAGAQYQLLWTHAVSMVVLMERNDLRPSAFALGRPALDAAIFCLATFVAGVTSPQQISRLLAGKKKALGEPSRVLRKLRSAE